MGSSYFFLVRLDEDDYYKWFFQWAFAATATTTVSGCMVERTRFVAYLVYSFLITSVIYATVVHWVWVRCRAATVAFDTSTSSAGEYYAIADVCQLCLRPGAGGRRLAVRMGRQRCLRVGMIDFAGSGVVHMLGGVAGLVGSVIVGARSGRFDPRVDQSTFAGHSLSLTTLGVYCLWFGW